MTVCIAATCANKELLVIAADRMVTAGPPMNLEFEHENSKIDPICDNCVCMTSGNALIVTEILKIFGAARGEDGQPFEVTAEHLAKVYAQVRLKKAEQSILAPAGITHSQFLGQGQGMFPAQIYGPLFERILNFNLGVEILVAGVDDNGGHISHIHHPTGAPGGIMESLDRIGFNSVGSGRIHAQLTLVSRQQSINDSVERTLYNVYKAKLAAEIAPGVGTNTDMMVIMKRGTKAVKPDMIEKLKKVCQADRPADPDLGFLEELKNDDK